MKVRRIIITNKQLNEVMKRTKNDINEESTVTIAAKAKGNSLTDYSTAATSPNTLSDIQKAKAVGDVNLKVTGPKEDDSQPTQEIDVTAGDTVQNAISTQGNPALVQNGGAIKITGDNFGEGRVYTKKSIEEARLKKMRMEGKTFTKKQLNETFLLEGFIEDKLDRVPVRKALKGYEALGGVPQDLATEPDMAAAIIRKYNEATPELQKAFMDIINS